MYMQITTNSAFRNTRIIKVAYIGVCNTQPKRAASCGKSADISCCSL